MEHHNPKESLIPFYLLSFSVFIIPILFLPTFYVPLGIVKSALIYIVVIISLFTWMRSRLRQGKINIVYSPLLLSGLLIPLVYLLSSVFSTSTSNSLIGTGTEISTFFFIMLMFLVLFLVAVYYRAQRKILFAYLTFLGSASLVETYHILRFFIGLKFLSFGFFDAPFSTPTGSWLDLSIFAGFAVLIALSILDFMQPGRFMKLLIVGVLTESVIVLFITNYFGIWLLLIVMSITMAVYRITYHHHYSLPKEQEGLPPKIFFPIFTGCLILISIIGLQGSTHAIHEIRDFVPSLGDTIHIAENNISSHPFLGAGPNRFITLWDQYKPQYINTTDNWDIQATHGSGYIPTAFATMGLLGILSWLIFIGSLLYFGTVILFIKKNPIFDFYIFSSFLATIYFIVIEFFYYPGIVNLFFGFFSFGLFISALLSKNKFSTITIILKEKRFKSGVYYVFILFLCIAVLSTYIIGRKYVAGVFFQKGVLEMSTYPDYASQDILRAIKFSSNDLYDRTYSEMMTENAKKLTATPFKKEESASKFQEIFNQAEGAATKAMIIDTQNYENWMAWGDLYSFLVPLNFKNAYENSKKAYEAAAKLNPNNPRIEAELAKIAFSHRSFDEALQHATHALELKPDYTDAAFLIVQIKAEQKDLEGALTFLNEYIHNDPKNLLLYYERGVLLYAQEKYDKAASVFESIIAINSYYANAKYYLAFSYYKLGRTDLAISLIESVAALNPSNQEVAEVLKNLHEGKSPFLTAPALPIASSTATTTPKKKKK